MARERAQWLRARAEDLGLIPNTYMVAHLTNASLRIYDAPFCPLQVLHAHGVQTHLQVHRQPTLIKKITKGAVQPRVLFKSIRWARKKNTNELCNIFDYK